MDNIEIIVKNKLKDLGLTPILKLSDFRKKKKRFYVGPFLNEKKEKVFFKILIVNNISPIESIKKEIKVRDFLTKYENKILFPHLIKYDNKQSPYWFISQYREGLTLGYFYELYDENEKYIPLVVNALFELHKISYSVLKNILKNKEFYLWENGYEYYLNSIKSHEKGIEDEIVKKINFPAIYQFLKVQSP